MTNHEKYKYEAYHFPDDRTVKMVMSEESYNIIRNLLEENEQLNKEIPALLNRIDELQGMIVLLRNCCK